MTSSRFSVSSDAQVNISTLSINTLLQQACMYLTQKQYLEGMALLSFVKKNLQSEHEELTDLLDPIIKNYEQYIELQQQFLKMNSHMIEIQNRLQVSIIAVQQLQNYLFKRQPACEESVEQNEVPFVAARAATQESDHDSQIASRNWYAICLAPFELYSNKMRLELCANRNGQALLRYLINQNNRSATTDTLMALLWPNDTTDIALNKLYVAVSLLRRSLQKSAGDISKYIIYKHGFYQLDPLLEIRTDVDDFLALHHTGRKEQGKKMMEYYEQACLLYKRPFLLEDLYANWSFQHREHLRQIYITMCHALVLYHIENKVYEKATGWASRILEENRCDEEAHQHLIRIYALRGRRHDALRQFQLCQQILQEEMNVEPMDETANLFKSVMRGDLF